MPWVLAGCGCLGIGGVLLLGIVSVVAIRYASVELSDDLKSRLAGNPQIQEHVGEIRELNLNLMKTGAEDDEDIFIYDVVGSKASGELRVVDSDFGDFQSVQLRRDGDEWFEIDLGENE